MGTQELEEQVGRRENYKLRMRKAVNYKEKEEGDVEEDKDEDIDATKGSINATNEDDATGGNETKEHPDVNCPVCWSSLVLSGLEVLALGCGHLVCGQCVGEVVLGGRGCPVCRDREAVSSIRRVFF